MTDNQSKSSIKFRQTSDVTIVLTSNDACTDQTNITYKLSHITIGPLVDRVKYVKCFYAISVDENPDFQKISKEHFTESYNSEHEIRFTTKYKEFKKYFKIVCARELNDLSTPLSDQDLINDLDFMKSEIVTCQINMNLLKQKGDMTKYAFYDNMINKQQHLMFQVPTPEQYASYLDKIAKLLDKNVDDVTNKEKQIMNDVMEVSKNVW